MSLFEDLAKNVLGGQDPAGPSLASAVFDLIHNQPGGLSGLVRSFRQNGLGDIVSSWIGTGRNLPVSADQLHNVLGSEQVQALAQKLGLPLGEAGEQLASLLPRLIDGLTPDGRLPG